MNGTVISCCSCQASWRLPFKPALYYVLNLVAHPCPSCGAETLACSDSSAASSAPASRYRAPYGILRRDAAQRS